MGRHKLLHEQISRIHSFERDRYKEFSELCKEQAVSVSEGLRNLIEKELEKKALGVSREANPCNISYITYTNEPKNSSQSDLLPWLERVDGIDSQKELLVLKGQGSALLKRVDIRSKQLYIKGIRE